MNKLKIIIRVFLFSLVLLSIYSCGSGGGPTSYLETGINEFNIQTKTKRLIKIIGDNEDVPFIRYFNNSKKIIYGLYNYFDIINENGKEERINLDSLWIDEGYFSISPNNNLIVFGGTIIISNSQVGTIYKDRGAYVLNLATKEIKLIATDSINVIEFPTFSNDGNMILFKSKAFQNFPSALFICNIDGSNKLSIAYNDHDGLKYGMFSSDDKNVIFVQLPDKICIYNLATKSIETLVGGLKFADGITIKEYPLINVSKNQVLYYSRDNDSTICSSYHVYEYDLNTKQNITISLGIAPISITNNYILIGDSKCSAFETSDLRLLDNYGNTIINLPNGYKGEISYDNTSIIYIYLESKNY